MEQEYLSNSKKSAESERDGFLIDVIEVRLTVYGEPVPKSRPRVTRNHTYTPARTVNQEKKIAMAYKSVYRGFMFAKGVPLRLEVDFYVGVAKSDSKKLKQKKMCGDIRPTKVPDLDNEQKLVQDALNQVAFYDDSQIVESVGRKFYSDNPRTEIKIIKIGGGNGDR